MHSLTSSPPLLHRQRHGWLVRALFIWLVLGAAAASAQSPRAYYSTESNVFQVTPSSPVSGSGTVTNGGNATDGDFSTFATLQIGTIAPVGPVGLRLKLVGVAPAGYRAGVLLANATDLLSLDVLPTVRLRTYLSGAVPEMQEERVVRADVVRASLLQAKNRPTQLEFVSSKSFDAVEIEIGGLLNVAYSTNIFYAYGVQLGVQTRATGYLSQFAAPTSNEFTSGFTGTACLGTAVDNPEQVADFNLTNFATFRSVLTVDCLPFLRTKLAGVPAGGVPTGYHAGFVVGQAGLLDAGVLSGLRVTTYLGTVLQESRTGTGLLELSLLPGGKAQVSFPATKPFDGVKISRTGLVTTVDNLNIFYGFGLEPGFFKGLNPVLTKFLSPNTPEEYLASQTVSLGLIISEVVNPSRAADNDTLNYAELKITGVVDLVGTTKASLRLKLNGAGLAGNRVGMVIQQGAGGLLDVAAIQRLTLLTYDINKNLIETKTGSELLTVSLLAGSTDKFKVSFLATRNFTFTELEVNSAASVSSNTRVYCGFAEDARLLSFSAPLPVELSAFSGRWVSGAAELNWATASEKNSSHFVVERSTGQEAAFKVVGQVKSVGNSSRAQTYKLRDDEAAAQGVAILYYRLRQVDVDGKESFSPLVSVRVGQRNGVSASRLEVYPNPTADVSAVMVRFRDLPAGSTVQTYSQLGQLVSQMAATETAARLVLPASLAPGLYHVVLRGAAGQLLSTQRLVIKGR